MIETAVYVNSIGPVDPINMVSLPLNISLDSLSRVIECLYKPEQYLDNLYSFYSLNALSKKSPNSISFSMAFNFNPLRKSPPC